MHNGAAAAEPKPAGGRRTRRRLRLAGGLAPYLWLAPSLLLIILVTIFPIFELFSTALSKVSLSGVKKGYVGLQNFSNVLRDPVFWGVLKNTLIWTVGVVGISTVLSLGIAQLLNQEFPGRRLVRSALIVPWAVSLIITSVIWRWILDYHYGALNLILQKLHLIDQNIYWLASPATSFPAMIGVGIFVTIPFTSFLFLAGLQAIPGELYESAGVDGANGWSKFVHVTLPMLRQPLMISTVLNTIYVFNSFPIIWSMTKGEPVNQTDTIITYLYKLAFVAHKMGDAAAVSVISFLLLLLFSVAYIGLVMRRE